MTHILAKNLLRFGVKNLSESALKKLQEQDPNASVQPSTTPVEPGTFSSLESVWADPRLKNNVMVTAGEQKANPNLTRETKYNNIIWENLTKYYGTGTELLGKNAIGWTMPFDFSQRDLLLQEAITNFKIADIFVGKNHVLQQSSFTPGEQECIYICSEKMYIKPRKPNAPADGHVGNFYIPSSEWDETAMDIKSYYTKGIPKTLHLRIVGTNVYLSNGYVGNIYAPKYKLVCPLSDAGILNSIRQAF